MIATELELHAIGAIERGDGAAADPDLRAIAAWSRTYLLGEDVMLGRPGPVCPYTRTAIEADCYYLARPRLDGTTEAIRAVIPAYRDAYLARAVMLPPRLERYLTFAIVLGDYRSIASRDLDDVQASLKAEFVERGLMLGQFHPDCDAPGIWNADFRPLRSPIPLLAIRTMVKGDLPFLAGNDAYVTAYRARFG